MVEKHDFRVLIAYPNLSMMLTPSYAVALFTAILRNQGYEIDLFDCTPYLPKYEFLAEPLPVTRANKLLNSRKFDPISLWGDPRTDLDGDFAKKLDEFKPHVVIFSTLVEDTWPQAQELLEVLRHYPEIKTLIGGTFTTMAPEIVIKDPRVQCIGYGEGEATVVDFCESVRHGIAPTKLSGTWVRDEDGQVRRNPPRPLVDIDAVVPDFSLFDERRFLRPLGARVWKAVPLETYRGCPYTCTFCNSPAQLTQAKANKQGHFLRRNTMDALRNKIRTMVDRYEPDFFYINDDAFLARPKRETLEFAEMYNEFKIPFWFQTRFEDIDREKLERLQEVGCYRISFGLEHGNEKYRREKLRRRMTNEFIIKQAAIVASVGIPYTLNIIVGFPYETRELIMETVRLCREIDSFDSLSVNVFVPYHGTPLRDMAIKEGWLDPELQTTSVIAKSLLTMPPPYLSGDEILGLQRAIPLYVRLPESRYPEIRRAEALDDEGDRVFEGLAKEFYELVYGVEEAERKLTYAG
jgi:anaerobic magnesium-protoporphyrin IX monomethyl ester cyclase